MARSFIKWWLPLFCVIIVAEINQCNGYFQEEKMALLEYKEFLKFYNYSAFSHSFLPSWVSDPNSDCCTWENVTCDASTDHVIHLSLDAYYQWEKCDFWAINSSLLQPFSLNLSLFHPLKELRSLNLSFNCFDGLIVAKDYRSMSTLKMLETLDLSYNSIYNGIDIVKPLTTLTSLKNLILKKTFMEIAFGAQEFLVLQNLEMLDLSFNLSTIKIYVYINVSTLKMLETLDLSCNSLNNVSIIRPLKSLTSLKNLILRVNDIEGDFPIQELSVLQSLEKLDLSDNSLHSPSRIQDLNSLSKLRKLKSLNLAENVFDEKIFKYLFGLPTLTSLILNDNQIKGTLDGTGLCNMKGLQELNLKKNGINGKLNTCLHNLTLLRILDLSDNYLNGSIPSFLITSLPSLEYLSLSNNNFEGMLSLSSMANHSNLKVLALGDMKDNKFHVETENPPKWIPSFQLKALHMSNCELNLPTRAIPSFLSYQHDLEYIDLSKNNLVGMFPNWLLVNNPKLQFFVMNDNSFTGSFQLPTSPNLLPYEMVQFDISHNKIQGQLPENIGLLFPHLESLDVSSNMFDGDIPASIGEMSKLMILELAHNNFSGTIPKHVLLGCMSLAILSLSKNSLQGQPFHTSPNWIDLKILLMDNNQFNGTLEDALLSMNALEELDVSNNNLSGRLPAAWIRKRDLFYLSVSRNNFEDEIPKELCEIALRFINLSHNNFSGAIPSCFQALSLNYIHLQGNSLTGTIPGELSRCTDLITIDLRDNKLSGSIPKDIYGLKYLVLLLLGGNKLQGELPTQLCNFRRLTFLDLSHNNFTGPIPPCFSDIPFAKDIQFSQGDYFGYGYVGSQSWKYSYGYNFYLTRELDYSYSLDEEVQLTTKSLTLSYKGEILNYISGLDLSFNQLSAEIPIQLGELSALHVLNLSHNYFGGAIPKSFHKLESIESLDLSYNNLSGNIPSQLQALNFLVIFNVSYNNLSGAVPDQGQFGTFDESSYKGNPHLHFHNSNRRIPTLPTPPSHSNDNETNESVIDFTSFTWTFSATFVMVQLILVVVLWVNPHWRRAWFYFFETCLYKCCGQFLPYELY